MKHDIAVIGMSVTLPQIDNLGDFWNLIQSGEDLVDEYPEYRREESDRFIRYLRNRAIKKIGSERTSFHNGCFLDNVEMFDYKFFNMTPKQANTTDPHHLLIMKTLYKALEDAGYANRIAKSNTGVFIGFANNPGQDYSSYVLNIDPNLAQVSLTGNVPCMLANRISHFLDINGPSTIVDSACSASLVATLNAARSVADGLCDMALVGGARVCTPVSEATSRIGIESFDGKTRSFDASADGTGLGEGSGAILIKRLDKALEDGDQIYSVIRGGAINHDGATEGITTPDSDSQCRLLSAAWEDAEVDPKSIQYMEAHGTATRIGDPIEINGMKRALAKHDVAKNNCAIGTVKTNIGHLFEGSGVMGVIKSSLCLHHKKLAPIANYVEENPLLELEESPLYVSDKLKTWPQNNGEQRRCGVSAFGLGGTNCHIILEEAPKLSKTLPANSKNAFLISALTEKSFANLVKEYQTWFEETDLSQHSVQDVCFTLMAGRKQLPYRAAFVVETFDDILKELNLALDKMKKVALKSSDSSLNHESHAEEVVEAFLDGEAIDGETIYRGKSPRVISLPFYQYDESRCHVFFPKDINLVPNDFKEDGLHTYHVNYVEEELDRSKIKNKEEKILLIDCENSPRAKELLMILSMSGKDVSYVTFGDSWQELDENKYTILNEDASFEKLADLIKNEGIEHIVHLSTGRAQTETMDQLEKNVDAKLRSLFYLSREVIKRAIKCHFSIITENVAAVKQSNTDEPLIPENSAVLGLSRVIPREAHFITTTSYDLDSQTPTRVLLMEFALDDTRRLIVYRNSKRYVEQFEYLDVNSTRYSGVKVREGGNYLITGGTGAIGLETAKLLAGKNNINLFLVSRSGLPDTSQWDDLIKLGNGVSQKISKIREIEALGSKVFVYAADCGNVASITDLVNEIHRGFGDINGIIHAAGNPGKNVISMRETKDFEEVIYPKIQGTFALYNLTREMECDFMVLFSTVASIFPTAGQGDYAAGNTYMDCFADQFNDSKTRIVAMQWAAWRDIGMAVDYLTNQDTTFKAIPTEQGIDCLDRGLLHTPARIFVGEINYPNPIVAWFNEVGIKMSEDIDKKISVCLNPNSNASSNDTQNENSKDTSLDIEVNLHGRASDTYTTTEVAIAKIWADALGYEDLDINDEFIDLGGESITAMTIARSISDVLGITVDVGSLMEHSTIESLSEFIENQAKAA